MALSILPASFVIERDETRCIACQVCVRQCANDVHRYVELDDRVVSQESACVAHCPNEALTYEDI